MANYQGKQTRRKDDEKIKRQKYQSKKQLFCMAAGISEEAAYLRLASKTVLVSCFNKQKEGFGCSWWKGRRETPAKCTKRMLRERWQHQECS